MPKSEGLSRPKANTIESGDIGIWVTCALHMKGKAAREMEMLFDDVSSVRARKIKSCRSFSKYAEKFYGIKSEDDAAGVSDEDQDDIESAIQKEVGDLKDKEKSKSDRIFTEVRINQECLLFMKCKAPIEPIDFCHRICQDVSTPGQSVVKKTRYLNRLTPLSIIVKATESGLEEGARQALANHFILKPMETSASADLEAQYGKAKAKGGMEGQTKPATVSPSTQTNRDLG